MALASMLLPQPGIPVTSTPLGAGNSYFCAESSQLLSRFFSQRLRLPSPPTSSILTSLLTNSRMPVLPTIWRFYS
jgi:hypothetical protein